MQVGWHGGSVGTTFASEQEGPWFDSFLCRVCMFSLLLRWFRQGAQVDWMQLITTDVSQL